MSSAHIFYIPILILVGALAGYFLGRRAAEQEVLEARRREARKQALKSAAEKKRSSAADA